MTDFMAKMHQIQFRLGLRPRPRWGAYSAPDPLAVFGGLLLIEGEGRGGEGRGQEGRGGEGGSVPSVPVLRNDHCREWQLPNLPPHLLGDANNTLRCCSNLNL